jgi:hypothetical protein
VHQNEAHLKQNLDLAGDDGSVAFAEAFGAITSLKQESLPRGRLGELLFQVLDFPDCHQRRQCRELREDGTEIAL